MQIRPGACRFERCGLGGPAARDDRVGRAYGGDRFELCPAQLVRCEAEQPDAPRPAGQPARGLGEQGVHFPAVHDGQGQKGQAARIGHGGGEGRPVADPGHGALDHGQQILTGARQEGPGPGGRADVAGDRRPDRLDDTAGGAVARGEAGGRRPLLADG